MKATTKGSMRQIPDKNGVLVDPESTKAIWKIQLYVGKRPHPTKPNRQVYDRRFETFRGNQAQAMRRLKQLSHEVTANLAKGIPVPTGRVTVTEALKAWLNSKAGRAPKTLESYQSIVERHLIPNLGHHHLKDLQPSMIQQYYAHACEKLSARSVHYHHRLLKAGLKYAVRQGFLGRNVCDLVDPPSFQKKKMRTLAPEEVRRLLEVANETEYYPIVYVALSSGLRRAELLGLRWRDLNLGNEPTISVSRVLYKAKGVLEFREPKTANSRRSVTMTQKLRRYMKDYKAEKESFNLHIGRIMNLDDIVFSTTKGKPFDPHVVSHNFAKIAKRAGLEGTRFHDLRHSFATLMLDQGAPPKIISDCLGHASVAFTMDTYAGKIPSMEKSAMAKLNKVLPEGAINNGRN